MKNKILVFFIIGFVLYLIDIGLNNYDDKEIFISDSEITSLITAWRSQVGRNPNDDEVARIINDLVQEEILYREGGFKQAEHSDTHHQVTIINHFQ